MVIAYAYVRCSTKKQALGDSPRRKIDASRDFARKQGWQLDESLRPDMGLWPQLIQDAQ